MNSKKTQKTQSYRKISHAERISIIYSHIVHKKSMQKLCNSTGITFNSVRNFIDTYRMSGRTNRKSQRMVELKMNSKCTLALSSDNQGNGEVNSNELGERQLNPISGSTIENCSSPYLNYRRPSCSDDDFMVLKKGICTTLKPTSLERHC